MNHIGKVIYQQRIAKNWNQEDLCRGICAVSYLSKIETGKADPSSEILKQLLERLEIRMDEEAETKAKKLSEEAYELVFSAMNQEFRERMAKEEINDLLSTRSGMDLQLLKQLASPHPTPLSSGMEANMDQRQKAVQRIMQGRCEEALLLYPNAWMYLMAGIDAFEKENISSAYEYFTASCDLAARTGEVRVMLSACLYQCRCAARNHDDQKMREVSLKAERIARALSDRNTGMLIAYNRALSAFEAGSYEEAYAFFASLEKPNRLSLLMKAAAAEQTGKIGEAFSALKEASAIPDKYPNGTLVSGCLKLLTYRIQNPEYLNRSEYGEALRECFDLLRREPQSGCEAILIRWMLEWCQASRQYKKAYELLEAYPWIAITHKNNEE